MAEEDPVDAIERALGSEPAQDFDRVAELQLRQLQQDYEATLAADIRPEQEAEGSSSDEPPPQYEICHSDSDEDEEEWGELQGAEATTEEVQNPVPRGTEMPGDQVKRIKEAMRGLALPPPAWAAGLSDEAFLRFVSERIK